MAAAAQVLDGERVWARALDPAVRARVLADQRLLIRRAGPQVHTRLLWLPPPVVLVPEDIRIRAKAAIEAMLALGPPARAPKFKVGDGVRVPVEMI